MADPLQARINNGMVGSVDRAVGGQHRDLGAVLVASAVPVTTRV